MAAILSQAIAVDPVKDLECMLDPGKLAEDGAAIGVIFQHVKKGLDCLDSNVPKSVRLRYLLLHAHEHCKDHPVLKDRWHLELHKRGISSDLVNVVTFGEDIVPSCGYKSNYSLSGSTGYLSVNHILPLTEILVEASHKWREIATNLNLPKPTIANIEVAFLLTKNSKICLCVVLKEWIVGRHEHAAPPTLKSLRLSLASMTVNLGYQANLLEEKVSQFWENLIHKSSPISQESSHCNTQPSIEIVSQSCPTEVGEGKSTLLEVQAVSHSPSGTISYQWAKDGVSLTDNKHCSYVGSNMPVLCINNTSLATTGTFTCTLELHSSEETVVLHSKPIAVTVKLLLATKVLVDTYSSLPDIQKNAWPPVSIENYNKLALIKQTKRVSHLHITPQGSVDSLLTEKTIPFEEAFGRFESRALLLIKGRPGSGKSTIVNKIVKDWAKGKSILTGARLVFFVPYNTMHHEMKDLLDPFYLHHKGMSDEVLRDLNSSNGDGVCFVVDGLDDLSINRSLSESIISRLVHKKHLQKSMIIVASRPAFSENLLDLANTCIEVAGFSKEDLLAYISNYPFKSPTNDADKLIVYLADHPTVQQSCYLPLYAAIIAFMHDEKECGLPKTETEVYRYFTKFTLFRLLKNIAFRGEIEELSGDYLVGFQNVCRLAFELLLGQSEFTPQSFSDIEANEIFLGFVSIDYMCGFYCPKQLYSFSHQNFQEFLAAYHISKLKETDQKQIIASFSEDKSMLSVLKFYCGLVDEIYLLATFEDILNFGDTLFHCQCAFESQQSSICDPVVLKGNGSIAVTNLALTHTDLTSIAYVISNTGSVLKEFTLSNCNIKDVRLFSNALGLCNTLQHLNLSHNSIGDFGVEELVNPLCQCNDLVTLNLSHCAISEDGAASLFCLEFCDNLKCLNLEGNRLGDGGLQSLCDSLKSCSKLEHLVLDGNNFGSKGAEAVSNYLKRFNNLLFLSVGGNNIDAAGVALLASGLKYCPSLLSLKLDHSRFSDHSAHLLFDNLKQCTKLQALSLTFSELTDNGIEFLSDCILGLNFLEKLSLDHNLISDIGAETLAKMLHHSRSLAILSLKGNSISSVGIYALNKAVLCDSELNLLF